LHAIDARAVHEAMQHLASQHNRAERHLDDIGPGDFFGEIAALDWGASFGYARLATVTATSPMRLLVLTSADLLLLMNEMPQISAQVNHAVRDRLPGL
jgi:CRP/FNR family cyclic AMP-dependent transcriptional regulator